MEEESYSANGVKHCVRPCDMTGKSSAVILRQMHPNVIKEATKLDRNIDLPMWMSTLTLEDQTVGGQAAIDEKRKGDENTKGPKVILPFYKQKELECEWLERQISGPGCSKAAQKITAPKGKSIIIAKNKFIGFKRPLNTMD